MQRDEEIHKLMVMGCISTMILSRYGKEDLDQSEDELIDELYQTAKTEYPILMLMVFLKGHPALQESGTENADLLSKINGGNIYT